MSDVLVAQDGSVATITLSRPERKNAMTVDAWRSMRETSVRSSTTTPSAR